MNDLRDQVLLALLALAVLGLGAGHADVCGVRPLIQQVVEGVQVVRLSGRAGWGVEGKREGVEGREGLVFLCHLVLTAGAWSM